MAQGKVYLVGAGPGDYRLITLKGLSCIKQADVIVYDRLADERLLRYAKPEAELVYVGKAASRHTVRQEDINRLLAERATAGDTVVRLKGGDPFVFGRGGEEALYLRQQGLAFEVVPGVTAAVAVPAYAGIPVTHRGLAASFTVVTGHEDPTKATSQLRWQHLAGSGDTLVFLMGVENLPGIVEELLRYGRSADTPAALIRWGGRPEQMVVSATLATVADEAARRNVQPPAVLVVGAVAALRQQLAWFDTKPLFGRTVLVTRAREQASTLTTALEELGAACIETPVIRLVPPVDSGPLERAIRELSRYDWVIFTSANGVRFFWQYLRQCGLDARAFARTRLAAIGVGTAAALAAYGLTADVVPAEFRAEELAAALAGEDLTGRRVLIPRAAVARDVLPTMLAERGAQVTVVEAYTTTMADTDAAQLQELLRRGGIDVVTFTSSSTVANLLRLLGPQGVSALAGVKVACIGPITAAAAAAHGLSVTATAERYTIDGLVQAIVDMYGGAKK